MRRDFQILVPKPGKRAEAERVLATWIASLTGTVGFRGGTVMHEYASELMPDTLVLFLDFDSIEGGRAFYKAIEGRPTPVDPDVPGKAKEQGQILFSAGTQDGGHAHAGNAAELTFDRGGGLFARLLHGHLEIVGADSRQPAASAR